MNNLLIPKKLLIFLGLMTLVLFVTGIFLERNEMIPWKSYDYKFLADYGDLDVLVETSYKDHGFLLMNDSIMVWGGHELIRSTDEALTKSLRKRMINLYGEDSTKWEIMLEVVPLPFRIVKPANERIFYVIDGSDSLTFELNEPNDRR